MNDVSRMGKHGKFKVLLYCRVSKRIGQTVENQIPILEEWAKNQGYDYEILTETESTRKTRPVREGIISRLRAGKADGVACLRVDRWLRSSKDTIVVKELVDLGREFFFITQGVHLCQTNNNAMHGLQLNMLSAFAEFERELVRERTLEGLARAISEGKTLGRRPMSKDSKKRSSVGYINRYRKIKGLALIDQ